MTSNRYFSRLNYTLGNEDTRMELAILRENAGSVLSVCGSGSRALPLLAKAPRRLVLVDVAPEQLWLAELRLAAMRKLPVEEYSAFLGYPPHPLPAKSRLQLLASLELSPDARRYFNDLFGKLHGAPILYEGRWEKTFAALSHAARLATGKRGLGLFECRTLSDQQKYLRECFPLRRWYAAVGLMGNAAIFNALLYKGSFPVKNIPGSYFQYYRRAFDRLFALGPARENFFLQIVFFGHLRFAAGNPIECDPAVYARARAALNGGTEVHLARGDLLNVARSAAEPFDFVSFSDVPSYFAGDVERQFMQSLRPCLNLGADVVVRSYLHVPLRPNLSGFDDVTNEHTATIQAEKTQMYLVDVYRRRS